MVNGLIINLIFLFILLIYFSKHLTTALISRIHKMEGPPVLTFYTKNPCGLCDIVMEELEPYKDRIVIEKVDITQKDNIRWLRLYRHDIPVLFLNGIFLCMHRLDKDLLERRLRIIDEENVN